MDASGLHFKTCSISKGHYITTSVVFEIYADNV